MSNIRHVVVVRKDLQLVPGLLAAQVAHISDGFIRRQFLICKEGNTNHPVFNNNELEWMNAPYLSVLAVNCAEDLEGIIYHAKEEELSICIWDDLIPSPTIEGKLIRARVGVSIGPDDFDKIKIVTGALPLY